MQTNESSSLIPASSRPSYAALSDTDNNHPVNNEEATNPTPPLVNGRRWKVCGYEYSPSRVMICIFAACVVLGGVAALTTILISKNKPNHANEICATVVGVGARYLTWLPNATIQGAIAKANSAKQFLCGANRIGNLNQIIIAYNQLDAARQFLANQTTYAITGSYAVFSNAWNNATAVDTLLYHTLSDNDRWFGIDDYYLVELPMDLFINQSAIIGSTVFACSRRVLEPFLVTQNGIITGYICSIPYQIDGLIKTLMGEYIG